MTLRLYNTLSRQEEPFTPSLDNTVRMYACGPTVYARAHIGNFRTFVCVDVLRRTLKYLCGFGMRQAVNYTDVDDKTIAGALKSGQPLREYTEQWIRWFRDDNDQLGVEVPEETPRATDEANMRAMGDLVLALEKNGHTYRRDGSIYFKISTLADYGKLVRLEHNEIQAGARLDVDEYSKDDARDFVLWKASKPEEPSWEVGVGPGRPGWHLECSAMALRLLGEPALLDEERRLLLRTRHDLLGLLLRRQVAVVIFEVERGAGITARGGGAGLGAGARQANTSAPDLLEPPPRPPRPPALPPAAPRPPAIRAGTCTVNATFARDISTCCFCITASSSACAPSRGSLAGRT